MIGVGTTVRRSLLACCLLAAVPAPHIDPYRQALAFAQCMRAHGVAHPNPDQNGDFHLTVKQEAAMKASATPKQREAAEKACFHLLKGSVSTQPLSKAAQKAALVPLRELKACLHARGYDVGTPMVKPMTRGRAMFGFTQSNARIPLKVQHACEQKVQLAKKLDAIIKADRGEGY